MLNLPCRGPQDDGVGIKNAEMEGERLMNSVFGFLGENRVGFHAGFVSFHIWDIRRSSYRH